MFVCWTGISGYYRFLKSLRAAQARARAKKTLIRWRSSLNTISIRPTDDRGMALKDRERSGVTWTATASGGAAAGRRTRGSDNIAWRGHRKWRERLLAASDAAGGRAVA